MENIELTTRETVEINTIRGLRKVSAHRFLDFAVHRKLTDDLFDSRHWSLTHMPTGRLVATNFEPIEKAIDAMIEIARMRNDWAVLMEGDFTEELALKVRDVVSRFGGYMGHRPDRAARMPTFNGYSPEVMG